MRLYSENEVFEIGHACAAREDLDKAISSLTTIVRTARERDEKAICFITGVPGSGKTLVGLNAVHHSDIRDTASFLSGNGPLVKILREALIRDDVRRAQISGNRRTRRAAETAVYAFIQSVHRFADDHYKEQAPTPAQRVIVFDEAQRAWDSQQNERAKREAVSEAHMMMDVMNRHAGWCVLVCLVGGGQEINRGEAGCRNGASLFGVSKTGRYMHRPSSKRQVRWFILFFSGDTDCTERISTIDNFHLKVSNRSIRATQMSKWVDAVLCGDPSAAKDIAKEMSSPPVVSRDISLSASGYVEKRRGLTRAGLVASSGAARLPDGWTRNFL